MGDSFGVNTGALHQHVTAIGAAQSAASQAADAGRQVTPGGWDNAYGLLCQSFPAAIRPVADLGIHTMQKIAQQLEAAHASLQATAERYDQQEHDTGATFTRLAGPLGSAAATRPPGPR